MHLRGRLRIERVAVDAPGTVVVRVEDVGRVDGSARTLAEVGLGAVRLVAGEPVELAFEVHLDLPPDPTACAVSAHVDTTGTGDVSLGDYITMEHVGITADVGGDVVVPLRRVGGDVP